MIGRRVGWWFGGRPKIDREITERVEGVGRSCDLRGPPGQIGMRRSPETSRVGRRFIGTPAGLEKVSREDYTVAASSLIRWGGTAAVVGAWPPASLGDLSHPLFTKCLELDFGHYAA